MHCETDSLLRQKRFIELSIAKVKQLNLICLRFIRPAASLSSSAHIALPRLRLCSGCHSLFIYSGLSARFSYTSSATLAQPATHPALHASSHTLCPGSTSHLHRPAVIIHLLSKQILAKGKRYFPKTMMLYKM